MVEPRENSTMIQVRAEGSQRDLIDQAAEQSGRSLERFMLDAACRAAEDVLLDQVFFITDAAAFSRFQSLLDLPPPPSDALRELMAIEAPWE
jgi:uncharacterized protein (DUF1778 family)